MGKKKIVKQTEEEALKDKEKVETAMAKAVGGEKAATSKKMDSGRIYINSSYNNIILSVTDNNGNVIAWASSGSLGFSGPKKATPFAASKIVSALAEKLKKLGLTNVSVIVKGVGIGRDSALRSLANHGFNILSIRDATPIPHNGPRPPKPRKP